MLRHGYLCLNGMIIPHEMMKVYPFDNFHSFNIACEGIVMALLRHIVVQFTQHI